MIIEPTPSRFTAYEPATTRPLMQGTTPSGGTFSFGAGSDGWFTYCANGPGWTVAGSARTLIEAQEIVAGEFAARGCGMSEHEPVSTVADLNTLDDSEIIAGYTEFQKGDPEPGNNRSRSYWHGWRNAAADRGAIPHDAAMRQLAREFLADMRARQPNNGVTQ